MTMKRISLEEMKAAVQGLWGRFPAALTFLLALTSWMILHIWDIIIPADSSVHTDAGAWLKLTAIEDGTISYYLSVATVLSIVLKFWAEEVNDQRKARIVGILAHVLLLADACMLWTRPVGSIHTELVLAHAAFITALIIAGIFLPFFRERDDLASWNLTLHMSAYAMLCPAACGIVVGGMVLLLNSLDWLFGIKIENEWYATLTVILMIAVAGCMWMSRLPEGAAKFDRQALTSKFLMGLVRYLFMPLIMGYLVVLYFYGAKILMTMQLPKGGVCVLVIELMIGCLGIEFLLYPVHRKAERDGRRTQTFEQWLLRWLPVIILPLLALMTVAIGRRIADYGITVSRLYILTLNVWFYAVCIGLYVTKGRRLHWVTLSFGALFLLTSALPVNYCSITLHSIEQRIDGFLAAHDHPALPLTTTTYTSYMKSLPSEDAERLRDDLRYLRSLYDAKEVARFVDQDVNLWRSFDTVGEDDPMDFEYSYSGYVAIPDGYKEFRHLTVQERVNRDDSTQWRITMDDALMFMIDASTFPLTDSSAPLVLPQQNGRGSLSVTHMAYNAIMTDPRVGYLYIEGYYFR